MHERVLVCGGEGKKVSAVEGRPHPHRGECVEEVAERTLLLDSGFVFRDRMHA